jgi:hypothetical protein
MKWARNTLAACLVAATAVWTAVTLRHAEEARLRSRLSRLEQEKARLVEHVRRLGATRRVARFDVLAQGPGAGGRWVTRLLWQEAGAPASPRQRDIEVAGAQVYVEALVVKFHPQHVAEGKPHRDRSLALFRRIFGDGQAPETGTPLSDSPDPSTSEAGRSGGPHADIWRLFWRIVEDPARGEPYGIRIAQCEAPAVPVRTGQAWEVCLDAAGGLNLRRLPGDPALPAGASAAIPTDTGPSSGRG